MRLMTKLFITLFIGVFIATNAYAHKNVNLYVGDMQTVKIGAIKRVAVGQGSIISTSILEDGHLLLLAEAVGETEMRVWLKDGSSQEFKIVVVQNDLGRQAAEIKQLIKDQSAVTLRRVGSKLILEGTVDEQGKALLEVVKGLYPDTLADMTKQAQVSAQKMVYMNVQITEFNTSALRNLGINWQNSFNGPGLGFATEGVFESTGEASIIDSSPVDFTFTNVTDVSGDLYGYFGIASQLTSTINLAKNSGEALILAEPSLSARSGGEAEFLSGGEVPLPVTGDDGQTSVEFKEFGIKLRIKPLADESGNIVAEVETEISTVDSSLAVNGIPGFRTRKASTDVSLKDGETLVISGLVNQELSNNVTNFAYLSDIPILGALFRSRDFRNAVSELVIFVTPYIFDEQSETNKQAIKHADEMRQTFLERVGEDDDLLE